MPIPKREAMHTASTAIACRLIEFLSSLLLTTKISSEKKNPPNGLLEVSRLKADKIVKSLPQEKKERKKAKLYIKHY